MKITPLDIRKKEFERAFRGYEKEEVEAFLLSLSQQWERVLQEKGDIEAKLEESQKEVSRMREMEHSLFKTLKTAEETSSHIVDQANRTADLHIREAQMNAEAILNEARSKARNIIEEAELEVRALYDGLQIETKNVERDYYFYDDQKENLLHEIRSIVKDTLDKVEKYVHKSTRESFEQKLKAVRNPSNESKVLKKEELNTPADLLTSQPVLPKTETEVKDKNISDEGSFFDNL